MELHALQCIFVKESDKQQGRDWTISQKDFPQKNKQPTNLTFGKFYLLYFSF